MRVKKQSLRYMAVGIFFAKQNLTDSTVLTAISEDLNPKFHEDAGRGKGRNLPASRLHPATLGG